MYEEQDFGEDESFVMFQEDLILGERDRYVEALNNQAGIEGE